MGIGEDQIQPTAAAITAKATQDYSDSLTDTFTWVGAFKAAGGGGIRRSLVGPGGGLVGPGGLIGPASGQ